MSKCREEFEKKLLKTDAGCMEWQGACAPNGYGHLYFGGRVCLAHRVSAYLSGLLDDLKPQHSQQERRLVLHKCDNRKCCNPDHLFIGSQKDNMEDAKSKGRRFTPTREENPNTKFLASDVAEMERLCKSGVSITVVAEKFGTRTGTISKIFKSRGGWRLIKTFEQENARD